MADAVSSSAPRTVAATPNPFVRETRVRFARPSATGATIEIFDAQGHRVRKMQTTGGLADEGVLWNGENDRGRAVPRGVYLARVTAEHRTIGVVRVVRMR